MANDDDPTKSAPKRTKAAELAWRQTRVLEIRLRGTITGAVLAELEGRVQTYISGIGCEYAVFDCTQLSNYEVEAQDAARAVFTQLKQSGVKRVLVLTSGGSFGLMATSLGLSVRLPVRCCQTAEELDQLLEDLKSGTYSSGSTKPSPKRGDPRD